MLDNNHYSADIATSYTGGTKLLTSGGVETTVTIYKASDEPAAEIQYQDAGPYLQHRQLRHCRQRG